VKEGALFKGMLDDALPATSNEQQPVETTLAKQIRDRLDRGVSLETVIQQLAAALATQVAGQLGALPITLPLSLSKGQGDIRAQGDIDVTRLTQAFTEALSRTGQGPPLQTNAERASALATRFAQIEGIAQLAARVTNEDQGQQIRSIAGTSLDADTAGADPTPAFTAPLAATPPAVPSDGRSVALAPGEALSSGGDSLLGRILARAWLAGDPAPRAPVQAAAPQPADTHPVASTNAPSPALDAFLKAFASALAQNDASRTNDAETHASGSVDVALPAAESTSSSTSSTTTTPAVPFALAVAHDGASGASVAPANAGASPQASQVDPQAVVDQIVRAMTIHRSDGQSEVRLRLVPEHLGDVSVKLVVSGGSVDATLTAHTADAQLALAGGQSQLAKTLADAGLKLASFTVGLAGNGFADTRDQPNQQSFSRHASVRRLGGVASGVEEANDLDLLATPSFGPPVYTPSGPLGALNYLV
jgi:flagellar hook-length control protein FliK